MHTSTHWKRKDTNDLNLMFSRNGCCALTHLISFSLRGEEPLNCMFQKKRLKSFSKTDLFRRFWLLEASETLAAKITK